MPTSAPLPTLEDFRQAYSKTLIGSRDSRLNTRTGGGYDLVGGSSALLWSRQARRDLQLFRECFRDTASGAALDRHVEPIYQVERTLATYGTGIAIYQRASAATAGTIYTGTRIEVCGDASPSEYVVTEDTDVIIGQLTAPVPIRAARTGKGVATNVGAGESIRLGDSVFDSGFTCISLVCGDGTEEERDPDYIARASETRADRRVGYQDRIVQICKDEGAHYVVALDAGTFGPDNDFGLNYVYVADSGFSSTTALKKDCFLALEAALVGGNDTQVLGMTLTDVTLTVAVTLWDDVGNVDTGELRLRIIAALRNEFQNRAEFWLFRNEELGGIVQQNAEVQVAVVTSSPAEPAAAFANSLPRYVLGPNAVTVTFSGPS